MEDVLYMPFPDLTQISPQVPAFTPENVGPLKVDLKKCNRVDIMNNCKSKLLDIITAEKTNNENYDCFAMMILTHGLDDMVFMTDMAPLKIQNIIDEFDSEQCPKLNGKPKLFFIHACSKDPIKRGEEFKGFWFIQAFVYIMTHYAHNTHLENMALKLDDLASEDGQRFEFRHTLRKDLFFFPE